MSDIYKKKEKMKAPEEFLMFSYFKITKEDFKEEETIILKCAERAYLDLCRTLNFKVKKHENFSKEMSAFIEGEISKILDLEMSKKEFDEKHKNLCKGIKTKAKEQKVLAEDFTYGQAQKWLNMTLKYMYLIGCWSEFFSKHEKYMHVPVDSIIIDAVWKETKIELPLKDDPKDKDKIRSTPYKKPSDHVKAWSQWEEGVYTKFQNDLQTEFLKNKSPLEWEAKVWIEYAKKEKGEEENDKIN